MMSDFDQFQEEVINAYREKSEKHVLPTELERASPTQLMNYCLTLLYRGELTEDSSTLSWIFNRHNKYPDLETGIKEFGASGFRSLQNFMMGRTTKPREHIVKLLAVLIDFQPRPYDKWVLARKGNTGGNQGEKGGEEAPVDLGRTQTGSTTPREGHGDAGKTGEEFNDEKRRGPRVWSKLQKPILYGVVAFSGMLGAYQIADNFDRECMYWQTDRYVPIACGEKMEGVEIIPLDKELVAKFRKIMRPDTLTLKSVGRVWYGKPTVDSAEFYTKKGVDPTARDKALKPATEYIIKKYVLNRYH